jgi:hypothetical protein
MPSLPEKIHIIISLQASCCTKNTYVQPGMDLFQDAEEKSVLYEKGRSF